MSRQEKSKQQSKGVITVRRSVIALFATILVAVTTLVAVALVRPPGEINPTAQEDEVQVALSTSGFTPSAVTHAAGTFAISVDNQNVTDEYILQLKAEDGTLLNEIRVEKGSAGWTVDLQAGVYTLSVANHSDWLCQITVQ